MTPISDEARRDLESFVTSSLDRPGLEIFQLAGDASARRYYRVASSSESWVLMSWEPFKDDGSYPFLSVRDHFAKHGVLVPNIVGKAPEKGLLLLEDLGDLTLERKFWENQSQKEAIPFYKLAIDELIKMHYPSTADRTDCTAFKMEFDVEKLLWELNYGREHLLQKLCGIKISELEKRELDKVFLKICETLHAEPKYIAHRDYHSRNIMLKFGKTRIIDFQDARLGPVQYDLVSLLRDSYVDMEDSTALELIGYYLDRRREYAPEMSLENFMRIYEVQTVQRCFKACGSFSSFYNLRHDVRYLKYLVPTLQRVRKSLGAFDDYKVFFDIMTDHGVFDRTFEFE